MSWESRIAKGEEEVTQAESLVMIQCVGCRNEDRNYCSQGLLQPCCEERFETERDETLRCIYISYFRDMRTYGFNGKIIIREASEKEV